VVQYKYTYDDLSQLIREDNRPLGYSYTYTYDKAGNILNKKRYSFTTGTLGTANLTYNYSYDDATWGDLLTSFGGNYIAYDEIGNPIKIGNYDEAMDIWWYGTELTWDGRELVSYRSFEYYDEDYTAYGTPITFTYNADGIRTSKTVNGVEHLYYLNGSQITAETWTSGVE
jgi:YD repeat-containing protein